MAKNPLGLLDEFVISKGANQAVLGELSYTERFESNPFNKIIAAKLDEPTIEMGDASQNVNPLPVLALP